MRRRPREPTRTHKRWQCRCQGSLQCPDQALATRQRVYKHAALPKSLASTSSTARRQGRFPSFLRTVFAMSSRLAPAARSAQIAPRAKASKRAMLAMGLGKQRLNFGNRCETLRMVKCNPHGAILNFRLAPYPPQYNVEHHGASELNKNILEL